MLTLIPTRKRQLDAFDQIFNDIFTMDRSCMTERVRAPLNVETDEKNVYLHCELPGLNKEDIKVEYKEGVLTISGEKKAETNQDRKGYHYHEISYGQFSRSVNVGNVNFEKGKADYKNGVLQIQLPKAEEAQPNRLQIK